MLEIWLDLNTNNTDDEELNAPSGSYQVVSVREQTSCDASKIRRVIRNWLRHCYASSKYVQSRVTAGAYCSSEDLYQKEKFPSRTNVMVRHGDFGEAVGHFILRSHPSFSFTLPVFRLRHKHNREKSEFGFDLIGFSLAEGSNSTNTLCIGEAKTRTSKDKQVILEGHFTLASYTRGREIEQTGRIAHWLFMQGRDEEYNKLAIFGDGWAQEEFERRHVFIGVFDKALLLQEMIEAMNEVDEVLSTFSVCAVLIEDLRDNIEEAYKP